MQELNARIERIKTRRRRERFLLRWLPIVIISVGAILRIVPVWLRPTWYDESFTVILARLPIRDLLAATAGDVHPPLWYLICWIPAHLGLPDWAIVRLPSVLASLASLWVFWLILRRMVVSSEGPGFQITALAIFALLPSQIYYAQEGRQYALLTLLVLLAWWCILDFRWLWLIVVTTAMLYLHNYGMFFAATLWLAGIIYWRSSDICERNYKYFRIITLSMAISGVLFVPWLVYLFRQMAEIHGSYWMVNFTFGSVISDIAHSFWSQGVSLPIMLLCVAVFWGMLGYCVVDVIRREEMFCDLPLLVLGIGPAVLAVIVSLVWQPVMLFRGLVPSGAFLVIFFAATACESLRTRWHIILAIFFVMPAFLVNGIPTLIRYNWPDVELEGPAIEYMAEHWQDGDQLLHNADGVFVALTAWEALPPDAQIYRVPECAPVLGGLSSQTRLAIGEIEVMPAINNSQRTWIYALQSPLSPACEVEVLEPFTSSPPVLCTRDDELVSACLYLLP